MSKQNNNSREKSGRVLIGTAITGFAGLGLAISINLITNGLEIPIWVSIILVLLFVFFAILGWYLTSRGEAFAPLEAKGLSDREMSKSKNGQIQKAEDESKPETNSALMVSLLQENSIAETKVPTGQIGGKIATNFQNFNQQLIGEQDYLGKTTAQKSQAPAKLTPEERSILIMYFSDRFSIKDLDVLVFKLGKKPGSFRHNVIEEYALDLLTEFEQDQNLSQLLELALLQRADHEIEKIKSRQLSQT